MLVVNRFLSFFLKHVDPRLILGRKTNIKEVVRAEFPASGTGKMPARISYLWHPNGERMVFPSTAPL